MYPTLAVPTHRGRNGVVAVATAPAAAVILTAPVSTDAIVVAVPHNEFNKFRLEELREKCRVSNPVLADLKGIYKKDDAESMGFNYFRL